MKQVLIIAAVLLMLASITRAQDESTVFIIHRPSLDIYLEGTQITAIAFDDKMYPIACDGYAPDEKFPCYVYGKNDSIPEFLSYIAKNGEVMIVPRKWEQGHKI